jgi:hypothetical protein
LRQICNYIPACLVPQIARATGAEDKAPAPRAQLLARFAKDRCTGLGSTLVSEELAKKKTWCTETRYGGGCWRRKN